MNEDKVTGARPCSHGAEDRILLAVFNEFRIGILRGSNLVDVSDCFPSWRPDADSLPSCIAEWPAAKAAVLEAAATREPIALAGLTLRAPVPNPRNLLGAPVNYDAHRGEVKMDRTGEASALADARSRGFFVKSASSIVGPHEPIELPALEDREFAYEGEVALIVGTNAKAVAAEDAWGHVFGLTGFLDVTLRPSAERTEERSMRKSYHSFGPLGPWVLVTETEPDLASISLTLEVNGEVRQRGDLSQLIQSIPDLIESGSSVIPLHPGDVFATGTPSGVGNIVPGDVVTLHVCPIGEMAINVVERSW